MIPGGYIGGKDFDKLTKAEARAFVIFELKEFRRHMEDMKKIIEDVNEIRRRHNL